MLNSIDDNKMSFSNFRQSAYIRFVENPVLIAETLERMWDIPFEKIYEEQFLNDVYDNEDFVPLSGGAYGKTPAECIYNLICCFGGYSWTFYSFRNLRFGEVLKLVEGEINMTFLSDTKDPKADAETAKYRATFLRNLFATLCSLYQIRTL